jgi:ribosomal protein L29
MPLMPQTVKYRKTQRGSPRAKRPRTSTSITEFRSQTLNAPGSQHQMKPPRCDDPQHEAQGENSGSAFSPTIRDGRPPETRMGKGKGQPSTGSRPFARNILFELDGIPETSPASPCACRRQTAVRTKFLTRHATKDAHEDKEIRELTPDELRARKRELREQVFHLRSSRPSGQLEKPSELRTLRREIARIETVPHQENQRPARAAK